MRPVVLALLLGLASPALAQGPTASHGEVGYLASCGGRSVVWVGESKAQVLEETSDELGCAPELAEL